jgi:hypothetical protein
MWTIRTMGGIALALAGTTWVWLTPAFAAREVDTSGTLWAVTRVLCLVTIAGFTVATVGLFARQPWWEWLAVASAAAGLITLVPYWFAADRGGQPLGTTAWNVLIHVLMVAGIFVLLLVPQLERWVDQHVMSG